MVKWEWSIASKNDKHHLVANKISDFFGQKNLYERLTPFKLLIDAELAVLKTLKKLFPFSKLSLCRVHILRNMRKKGIEIFGKAFFEGNKDMKQFWTIIKGIFLFLQRRLKFWNHFSSQPLGKNLSTKKITLTNILRICQKIIWIILRNSCLQIGQISLQWQISRITQIPRTRSKP